MSGVVVELKEWETLLPEKGSELYRRYLDDDPARRTAALLTSRGILEITELRDGLRVAAGSHVGSVRLGGLQINVRPKLSGMPLYRLLKYAYGLRDLILYPESLYHIDDFPLQELLIHQLWAEAEDLLVRGLARRYLRRDGELQAPRGRIDMKRLLKEGGITSAALPCVFFDRIEDNLLNRVLLAGLRLGAGLTGDLKLKLGLRRLCRMMEEAVSTVDLTGELLQRAWRGLDRLNENYRPALEIINILFESRGIRMEDGSESILLQGFFFDMNRFFQALLSKLLHELLEGYEVRDEYGLHGMFAYTPGYNPRHRKAPAPRPDFAVMRGNRVICLLDAKYRDLWETPLPREMLYQLAVYAISGRGGMAAKILYPTVDEAAKVQMIDLLNPATGAGCARVVLQPVNLLKLAELISGEKKREGAGYLRAIVLGEMETVGVAQ